MTGIQDDWTTMLRFDSDDHLEAWMNSEQRKQLLRETPNFSDEFHTRKIRSGFDPWFTKDGGEPPASWKVNMIVLLTLYPTVFLFGFFISTPLLTRNGVPFWLALFLGNITSTVLLGYWFVTWASRFDFWLHPKSRECRPGKFDRHGGSGGALPHSLGDLQPLPTGAHSLRRCRRAEGAPSSRQYSPCDKQLPYTQQRL